MYGSGRAGQGAAFINDGKTTFINKDKETLHAGSKRVRSGGEGSACGRRIRKLDHGTPSVVSTATREQSGRTPFCLPEAGIRHRNIKGFKLECDHLCCLACLRDRVEDSEKAEQAIDCPVCHREQSGKISAAVRYQSDLSGDFTEFEEDVTEEESEDDLPSDGEDDDHAPWACDDTETFSQEWSRSVKEAGQAVRFLCGVIFGRR